MGPFYFAIGYHLALLETQASHPDVTIIAYLDDSYYISDPAAALAAMRTGDEVSTRMCGVVSNLKKQEVYGSPAADLSMMPATLRGAPAHVPSERALTGQTAPTVQCARDAAQGVEEGARLRL